MSAPKIPRMEAPPSTPTRMDSPEALAVREEEMRKGRSSGYMSTVLTPLGAQAPSVRMKKLLGL